MKWDWNDIINTVNDVLINTQNGMIENQLEQLRIYVVNKITIIDTSLISESDKQRAYNELEIYVNDELIRLGIWKNRLSFADNLNTISKNLK